MESGPKCPAMPVPPLTLFLNSTFWRFSCSCSFFMRAACSGADREGQVGKDPPKPPGGGGGGASTIPGASLNEQGRGLGWAWRGA